MAKTILVVDDELDIAETLQAFLEAEGYEVRIASNGVEALHKMLDETPELVLTDLMMPRMDGPELIERMRSFPGLDRIPVFAMSGKNQPQSSVPFFRKPFDPSELVAAIRRELG